VKRVKRYLKVLIGIVIALTLFHSEPKIAWGENPNNKGSAKTLGFALTDYFGFEVTPYKTQGVVEYLIFTRTNNYLSVFYDLNAPPRKHEFFQVEIIDERVFEILATALNDRDLHNRMLSVLILGVAKDKRSVTPLLVSLKDEQPIVRKAAAEALGGIKDSRAVMPLITTLKDKELNVRKATAWALGEIKDARAGEPLIGILKDEDWFVRREAAKALREITGQDFGEDHEKWRAWWEKEKILEKKQ
jgi:hypothetical protein